VSHAYIGRDLLLRFGDLIKDHGTVERQPLLEGKSMSMTVASIHKPKTIIPSAPRADGSPADAPASDAPAPEEPSTAEPAAPPAPEAPPTAPAAGG
jgi:hypothetical protein